MLVSYVMTLTASLPRTAALTRSTVGSCIRKQKDKDRTFVLQQDKERISKHEKSSKKRPKILSERIRTADLSPQIRAGSLPGDLLARLPVRRTQTGNSQAGLFRSVSIDVLDGPGLVKNELRPVEFDDGFSWRKPGRRLPNWGVPEIEVNENLADRIGLGYEGNDFHPGAALGTD